LFRYTYIDYTMPVGIDALFWISKVIFHALQ
jgi:hypothetical protein